MTAPDVKVQLQPGQRILVHNEDAEPIVAIVVTEVRTAGRPDRVRIETRSDHMLVFGSQEWVHREDGEEI